MITIGVDAHQQLHAAVALDDQGKEVGRWRGANSRESWAELAAWASGLGAERQWGIEGAWNYGRGLAQDLVGAGETVYEVNPRWTALGRCSARQPGKSDALDATAVALLVRREAATLPRVLAEDETAILDLLVTERDSTLAEATRLRNQLHQMLLQLEPTDRATLPRLHSGAGLAALESYRAPGRGASCSVRRRGMRTSCHQVRSSMCPVAPLRHRSGARSRSRRTAAYKSNDSLSASGKDKSQPIGSVHTLPRE